MGSTCGLCPAGQQPSRHGSDSSVYGDWGKACASPPSPLPGLPAHTPMSPTCPPTCVLPPPPPRQASWTFGCWRCLRRGGAPCGARWATRPPAAPRCSCTPDRTPW